MFISVYEMNIHRNGGDSGVQILQKWMTIKLQISREKVHT